jgi:hypothetical protein
MTQTDQTRLAKEWFLAGDAIFTIQEPTGSHHTFRVQRVEANDRWPESWFIKMLTGPDNTSDYTYLGKLDRSSGSVLLTAKSRLTADSHVYKLLSRILYRVWQGEHEAFEAHGYQLHHEGRCGRCGRLLTVPESVQSGYGPECIKLIEAERF